MDTVAILIPFFCVQNYMDFSHSNSRACKVHKGSYRADGPTGIKSLQEKSSINSS